MAHATFLRLHLALIALILIACSRAASAQSTCFPRFELGPQFPYPAIANRGTDDTIYAATTWDPDGSGYQKSRLVVAGSFTHAGGNTINRVAMWDGTNWLVVGPQGFNGAVRTLVNVSGTLYAGGSFTASGSTTCNHVARYDPSTNAWLPVGNGFDGDVYCLTVGAYLYAGGAFSHSGATTTQHVARFDGTAWVPMGAGANGNVLCMATILDRIYVGGQFTQVDGVTRNGIAFWTSLGGWASMGSGINPSNNSVRCFYVIGSDLYIGGHFAWIGNAATTANNFAKYTPDAVGGGTFTGFTDLKLQSFDVDSIIQDGVVFYLGGTDGSNILLRYYNGTASYEGVGNSPNAGQYISTMAHYDGDLVVAGNFGWINGGLTCSNIARQADNHALGDWRPITPRLNGEIYTFRGFSSLLAGGAFEQTMPDYSPTMGLLAYNNGTFASYGVLNHAVRSLFVSSNGIFGLPRLYAGGNLSSAGTSAPNCNNIATWQGPVGTAGPEGNWATVSGGFTYLNTAPNATIYAETGYGTSGTTPILHVGGTFTRANGAICNHVAKLVSGAWQPLGTGVACTDSSTPAVRAFATFSGLLIAAGSFDTAGGLTANSIAAWNGTAWSTLGTGVQYNSFKGQVNAAVVFNGQLVVAGGFNTAGGVPAMNIAQWNGTSWSDLGAGFLQQNDYITACAVHNAELYIAAGIGNQRVLKWTGTTWVPALGTTDGQVNVLFSYNGELHLGGYFKHAGSLDSRYWAKIKCVCLTDLDDGTGTGTPDGGTDISDLLFFLTTFEAGNAAADLDNSTGYGFPDGSVDINDLLFFLQHFESGC